MHPGKYLHNIGIHTKILCQIVERLHPKSIYEKENWHLKLNYGDVNCFC